MRRLLTFALGIGWSVAAAHAATPGGLAAPTRLARLAVAADPNSAHGSPTVRDAVEQYRKGQYEAAVATLEDLASQRDALSAEDRQVLDEYTVRAQAAVQARQSARAQIRDAQAALRRRDYARAQSLLTAAQASSYLPASLRVEAELMTQEVVAGGAAPAPIAPGRSTPLDAIRTAIHEGNFARAETLIEAAARTSGKPPRTTPADPPAAADGPATAAAEPDRDGPAPQAPAPRQAKASREPDPAGVLKGDPAAQAKQLINQARQDLKDGRLDQAAEKASLARSLNARFRFWQDSPEKVLRDVHAAQLQADRGAPKPARPAARPSAQPADDVKLEPMPGSGAPKPEAPGPAADEAVPAGPAPSPHAANSGPAKAPGGSDPEVAMAAGGPQADVEPTEPAGPAQGPMVKAPAAAELETTAEGTPSGEPGAAEGDQTAKAKALVAQARKLLGAGKLDEAEKLATTAQGLDAEYGLFGETPDQVLNEIAAARGKTTAAKPGPVAAEARSGAVGDRQQAKEKLRQARAFLDRGMPDQAEGIATEVKSWPVHYSLLDDTPDKVLRAAAAVRQRRAALTNDAMARRNKAIAETLLADARKALKEGRLDEAAAKARQAAGLPVTYDLFADRPEAILQDVATARAAVGRKPAAVAAAEADPAAAEPAAAQKAENLLAKGKVEEAKDLLDHQAASAPADPLTAKVDDPAAKSLLEQANQMFVAGNYDAARRKAAEAAQDHPAVQAAAETLIARIALTEQARAVRLFEAGQAAMQKKDYGQAQALFTQVAASESALDDDLKQQVNEYLQAIPRLARGDRSGPSDAQLAGFEQVKPGTAKASDQNSQTPLKPRPADDDPIARVKARESVKLQELTVKVVRQIAEARRLMDTDPDQAIKQLEIARQAVAASRLPENQVKPLARRVEIVLTQARRDKVRIDRIQASAKSTAGQRQANQKFLAFKERNQAEVNSLMKRFETLMQQHRYGDAEVLAKKAVELKPEDPALHVAVLFAQMKGRLERNGKADTDRADAVTRALLAVDTAATPFTDKNGNSTEFGPNWDSLIRNRSKFSQAADGLPGPDPKTMDIERKLRQPVSFDFKETPLAEVVEFLRDYTGVNIVLDVPGLQEQGVNSDSPVTLRLEGVSLKSALKLVLGQKNLTFSLQDEVLMITSPTKEQGKLITKTYDVAQLVVPIPNFQPGNGGMGQALGVNAGAGGIPPVQGEPLGKNRVMPAQFQFGGGGFGGGGGLGGAGGGFGGGGGGLGGGGAGGGLGGGGVQSGGLGGQGVGQGVAFGPLIRLITETVAPDTWTDNGGTGSIAPFFPNLTLVISQTQAVHDQVVDLLRQLRLLQDLQVSLEVRFITLRDSFAENIGVNFNMEIPTKQDRRLLRLGAATAGGTTSGTGTAGFDVFKRVVGTEVNNLLAQGTFSGEGIGRGITVGLDPASSFPPTFFGDLAVPIVNGTFQSVVTGLPGPSLGSAGTRTGIAFLSDIDVYLVLQASQADNRSNIMQAPKLTLFNGQIASITVATQEAFIVGETAVVGGGAVAFDPTVAVLQSGTTLTAQAVVSADRRYVRLTLVPVFSTFGPGTTLTVAGASGGGGVLGGGGGASVVTTFTIPALNIETVQTTVTVPDGGTVLLGGLKTLSEARQEEGTPILDKIPYISRLFKNVGIGRDAVSIMLMVTPRIVILDEEEGKLGLEGLGTPP